MQIPVVRLSERERDDRLRRDSGGGVEFGESIAGIDSFQSDVRILATRLLNIAATGLGVSDPYFITPSLELHSWPRVEVCQAELLTPRLVSEVHAAVRLIATGSGIEICDALGCLESPFNIFVARDVIYAFAGDHGVLEALGLNGESFSVDASR